MIFFGEKFTLDWAGHPPGMPMGDYLIWERFRHKIMAMNADVYYNVGLSGQEIKDQDIPEPLRWQWLRATQKRIDVLLELPDTFIIIEIRTHAGAEAVGRLLQYKTLLLKETNTTKKIDVWLVTDCIDPDVEALCKELDVKYFVS